MTAGSSFFLLAIFEFVVFIFVIVRDIDLNFRYNHCLPMRRNFVTGSLLSFLNLNCS
jgi:hypothetical protein